MIKKPGGHAESLTINPVELKEKNLKETHNNMLEKILEKIYEVEEAYHNGSENQGARNILKNLIAEIERELKNDIAYEFNYLECVTPPSFPIKNGRRK